MKLKDKKIVITGAGSGIGKELVKSLLKEGSFVIGVDVNSDNLENTKQEINDESFVTYVLDVSDREKINDFKTYCTSTYGQIDGLINNAGIVQPFVSYSDMSEDVVSKIMKVNLFGPLHLIKLFLPEMLNKKEAHIVNVSSMAGFFPFPKQSIYGASKAALKIFSEGLYAELLDTNVHVTVVMPGAINTNILKNSHVEMKETNSKYNVSMEASEAARIIVDGIKKNKFQIFLGKDAKFMNFMYKLNPKRAIKYINKKMKNLL